MAYAMTRSVSFAGNLQWKVNAGDQIDFNRGSPAEWTGSVKYAPTRSIELQSGFGTGIGKGYGSPDYRIWAGVSYVPKPATYQRPGRVIAKRKVAARKPVKKKR